jgi:hypothetical protein
VCVYLFIYGTGDRTQGLVHAIFLNNMFIEIELEYHKIHPFKMHTQFYYINTIYNIYYNIYINVFNIYTKLYKLHCCLILNTSLPQKELHPAFGN